MLSYEDKMKLMAQVKPEYKDVLLLRLLRGETVDITKDEDLFYQINASRVTLDEFTNRKKFKASAEEFKQQKANMNPNAKSKGSHLRLIGEIPSEIYFTCPQFSSSIDSDERKKNIRKFLNDFPAFRVSDKRA